MLGAAGRRPLLLPDRADLAVVTAIEVHAAAGLAQLLRGPDVVGSVARPVGVRPAGVLAQRVLVSRVDPGVAPVVVQAIADMATSPASDRIRSVICVICSLR